MFASIVISMGTKSVPPTFLFPSVMEFPFKQFNPTQFHFKQLNPTHGRQSPTSTCPQHPGIQCCLVNALTSRSLSLRYWCVDQVQGHALVSFPQQLSPHITRFITLVAKFIAPLNDICQTHNLFTHTGLYKLGGCRHLQLHQQWVPPSKIFGRSM